LCVGALHSKYFVFDDLPFDKYIDTKSAHQGNPGLKNKTPCLFAEPQIVGNKTFTVIWLIVESCILRTIGSQSFEH